MRTVVALLGFTLPLASCDGRKSPGQQHVLEAIGSDDSVHVASRTGATRSSSACDARSLAGCEMQPRLALTTGFSAHRFVPKDDTELLSAIFTMWNVLDSLMRRYEPTQEFQAGYLRELQLRRTLQPTRELQLRRMLQLTRELPARTVLPPWQYCEVGMNGGHSLAAILQADPRIHATVFDLMAHNYSAPVAELLGTSFGAGRINLVQGNSHTTLKTWAADPANQRSCDLIFIDGDHTGASERDIRDMQLAARPGAKIVLDDIQMAPGNAMRKLEREHVIRVLETHGPYRKGDVRSPPMRTPSTSFPIAWGFAVAQYGGAERRVEPLTTKTERVRELAELYGNWERAREPAEPERVRELVDRRQEARQTPPPGMQASALVAESSAPNVSGQAKPSLADIHFLSPLDGGRWSEEVPEAEFIHWAVHAGDKVLEIGANIGRSGIVAAHCAAPGGSVVSSEADPSRLERAKANAGPGLPIRFVPAISATELFLPEKALHGGIAAATSSGGAPSKTGATMVRVPTMHPRQIVDQPWDVVIADCEGCFSVLLQEILSAEQLLNATRAVVLENDDSSLHRQKATNRQLLDLGFQQTVCVAHPWEAGNDPYRHGCFYSLLTRGGERRADALRFARRKVPLLDARNKTTYRREDVYDLFWRVSEAMRSLV